MSEINQVEVLIKPQVPKVIDNQQLLVYIPVTLITSVSDEFDIEYGKLKLKNPEVATHIYDRNNPHRVTKDQIGLGKVDNTSDKYKPISIPQQKALDAKLDVTGGIINGNLTVTGDFTTQGKTFIEEATTLAVKNAIIETNAGKIDLNTQLSGLVINKNSTEAYGVVYDPTDNTVKFGQGTVDTEGKFNFIPTEGEPIAIRDDSSKFTESNLVKWDADKNKFVDAGESITSLSNKFTISTLNLFTAGKATYYDEATGITIISEGEIKTKDNVKHFIDEINQEIPLTFGDGLSASRNTNRIEVKVDETIARTNQENTFTKPIKFGNISKEYSKLDESSVAFSDGAERSISMSVTGIHYTNVKSLFSWGLSDDGVMYYKELNASGGTLSDYHYSFPEKSGTFALMSDLDGFVQDPHPGANDTGASLVITKNDGNSNWGTSFKRNSDGLVQNANAFDFVGYGDSGEIYAKTTTDSDYSVVNKKYFEQHKAYLVRYVSTSLLGG